jgi:ferredoxin
LHQLSIDIIISVVGGHYKNMAKKVRIDRDACIGCGLCVSVMPEVFEFDDEGKARVHTQPAEGVEVEVANDCPTGAIIVED